ncbi:hypothetical protein D3C84_1187010 [compost metagenome]
MFADASVPALLGLADSAGLLSLLLPEQAAKLEAIKMDSRIAELFLNMRVSPLLIIVGYARYVKRPVWPSAHQPLTAPTVIPLMK